MAGEAARCGALRLLGGVCSQATRALLREALKDPLNKRFVLLSETCNPLLPAATVYTQLMAEPKSRINACAMSDKSRNVERCAPGPLRDDLHFRKTGHQLVDLLLGDRA